MSSSLFPMQSHYWISGVVANNSCSLYPCSCYKQKNSNKMFAETIQDHVSLAVILHRGHFSFHSDLDRLQKYLSSIFSGSAHFLKNHQLCFLFKICISFKNLTGWPSFLWNYKKTKIAPWAEWPYSLHSYSLQLFLMLFTAGMCWFALCISQWIKWGTECESSGHVRD